MDKRKSKYPHWKLAMLPAFQSDVSDMVRREVITCASSLIGELLENEKYQEELIPICSKDNWIDSANENDSENKFEDEDEAREYCEENNLDPHTDEALEHWIVSSWLLNRLEENGEMVLKDFLGLDFWGRKTSGQSISIDYVIEQIYLYNCCSDERFSDYEAMLEIKEQKEKSA